MTTSFPLLSSLANLAASSAGVITPEQAEFAQLELLKFGPGEAPVLMRWVKKFKRDKVQDRLLVISRHRVLTLKDGHTGRSVQRSAHLYDLISCRAEGIELSLDFGWGFECRADPTVVLELCAVLWRLTANINVGFPVSERCVFAGRVSLPGGAPRAMDTDFLQRLWEQDGVIVPLVPIPPPPPPHGDEAFFAVFTAYCSYARISPSAHLIEELQRILRAPMLAVRASLT
jgi:hypothetical protein